MKVTIKTIDNKDAGEMTLDAEVFGADIREDILHRMVNYQLAKRRLGTRKTQERWEVSGTRKKPFKQKGTGNARAGDLRRNIDRGGAVVHGPVVRSHAVSLPKKIRKMAMRVALSSKAAAGKLVILDQVTAKSHKTKDMAVTLSKFGFKSALIVGGKDIDENFSRATANIPLVDVLPSHGANVYDILRRDILVLTKDAVSELTEKLKG